MFLAIITFLVCNNNVLEDHFNNVFAFLLNNVIEDPFTLDKKDAAAQTPEPEAQSSGSVAKEESTVDLCKRLFAKFQTKTEENKASEADSKKREEMTESTRQEQAEQKRKRENNNEEYKAMREEQKKEKEQVQHVKRLASDKYRNYDGVVGLENKSKIDEIEELYESGM